MKLLHITYRPKGGVNGGIKRSRQLSALLRSLDGCDVSSVEVAPRRPGGLWGLGVALFAALSHLLGRRLTLRGAAIYVLCLPSLVNRMRHDRPDLVLAESLPGKMMLSLDAARLAGIGQVVFLHNVEFLVPEQFDRSFPSRGRAFEWESGQCRRASAVVTIDEFDAYVLQCSGVRRTFTLPYYPVTSDREVLQAVEADRSAQPPEPRLLLLGTAANPPTGRGMAAFLDAYLQVPGLPSLTIAGDGAERFQPFAGDRVRVLGRVSDDELQVLLRSHASAVVAQAATSGFLIRLVEYNLMGIPVHLFGPYRQGENKAEFGIHSIELPLSMEQLAVASKPVRRFQPPDVDDFKAMLTEVRAGAARGAAFPP